MPEAVGEEVDQEDQKIVTLARSARARAQAAEGAAVRDTEGRTYVATTVDQPSFSLTAMQAAVAAAMSSGADEFEAAAVVSESPLVTEASVHAIRDVSVGVPIFRADLSGSVREVLR